MASGGDLFQCSRDILTNPSDFSTFLHLIFGFDKREQIFGGRRVAIGDFLHGRVPWHRDKGRGEHLGSVSEPETFDVAFPYMRQVRKAYAPAIDAEEEHVTGKCLCL